MNWTGIAIDIGIVLYILTILAIIYTIILENRNPVRTLAWILVLVLAPGIGLLFYIYFWPELPEDQDVLHERLGRLQVVAIHE